jgi:hypothetical protein
MSALWAPTPNGREALPAPEIRKPSLKAVPRVKPRLARIPFILVLIGVFGLGMTGLLMLNTTLQNQAFQANTLNRQASELAYTQADLESQLDQRAAPQVLAQRASDYGMRANVYPAFLVLPKGKVVGKPRAVSGNEMPTMVVKTPAQIKAEKVAAAARAKALKIQQAAEAKAKALRERQAAAKAAEKAREAAKAKNSAETKAGKTKKPAETKKPAKTKKPSKTTQKPGGRG